MSVRSATRDDADAIGEVVRRSMEASYSLGPSTIDAAVEEWFGPDALAEKLADEDYRLFVAEYGGDLVGVAECLFHPGAGAGDVNWVHVHPDFRGEGIGDRLFERCRGALSELGAEVVRGIVLADNAEGNDFYRNYGFEKVDERAVEVDGELRIEHVYHEEDRDRIAVLEENGDEVYVDRTDADPGTMEAFYRTYSDPGSDRQYGYQCGNCESLATAMDAMGRIECSDCGNTRKPTRWDGAYL